MIRDGGVVHERDDGRGDALTKAAGVPRTLLLDVVRFQAVAHRLVEEDAAPAIADDDRHRTGRGRARVQHANRRRCRLLPERYRRVLLEQLQSDLAAPGPPPKLA